MVTAGPGPRGARALGHRTGISPDLPPRIFRFHNAHGRNSALPSIARTRTHARIPCRLALACMHRSAGAAVGDGDPAALLHRSLERVLSVSLSIDEVRAAVRVRRRPTLRYLRTLTAPRRRRRLLPNVLLHHARAVAGAADVWIRVERTDRFAHGVSPASRCGTCLVCACVSARITLPCAAGALARPSDQRMGGLCPTSLSSTAPAAFAIRGRRPAPSHAPTHAHPPARTHAD